MFINGAINSLGAGIGVVLKSLKGAKFAYYLRLNFPATNNEAEYKVFIAGVRFASKLQVFELHIFSDPKLVINQVIGKFEAR